MRFLARWYPCYCRRPAKGTTGRVWRYPHPWCFGLWKGQSYRCTFLSGCSGTLPIPGSSRYACWTNCQRNTYDPSTSFTTSTLQAARGHHLPARSPYHPRNIPDSGPTARRHHPSRGSNHSRYLRRALSSAGGRNPPATSTGHRSRETDGGGKPNSTAGRSVEPDHCSIVQSQDSVGIAAISRISNHIACNSKAVVTLEAPF